MNFKPANKMRERKKNQIQCTVARPEFIKEGCTILQNKNAGQFNNLKKLVIRHERNKAEKAFSSIGCAMKENDFELHTK